MIFYSNRFYPILTEIFFWLNPMESLWIDGYDVIVSISYLVVYQPANLF